MSSGLRSRLIAGRALAHEAVIAEIVPSLRAAGIEPMLIKGPVTIALLYDDPNGRDSDDIDLLVRPADFDRALEVLGRHGFTTTWGNARPSEHLSYEETLRRLTPVPVTVDLHHALMLVPDGEALNRILRRDAAALTVGGVAVPVPTDGGSALILALHVAQHGTGSPRAFSDLKRACERLDSRVWTQAARIAGELGVAADLLLGLQAVPGGIQIVHEMETARHAAGLEARLRLRGHGGATRRLLIALRSRDFRAALIALRDGLAPSPSALRTQSPQTPPGSRGLALGYLRRVAKLGTYTPAVARESSDILRERLPGYLAGLAWSWRSCRLARRQLRAGGLKAAILRPPPIKRPGTTRGVHHGMKLAQPSCLERSLVRREWHLAQGSDIPIVIGIRNEPGRPFGAHAWLQGDPPDPGNFGELAVWPLPASPRP